MRGSFPKILSGVLTLPVLLTLAGCPDPNATQAKPPAQATAPTLNSVTPQQGAPAVDQSAQVRQVIANAEQAYQSGVIHYRQNKMDAAREDFDRAVDALLTSKLDVRGTQELSDELDKLLDNISQMELAALEQGNGLTRQTEISPAEEANDVTFPVDPNLRAAAEAQVKTGKSDLPLIVNEPVASFISFFSQSHAGHATLTRSLERAGRYKDMIQRVLREEGVPQDLIYQAVAESGFQPRAMNGHSGAGGMWQFMPSTGAEYGLTRNTYVDERFDPEAATRAYARYMKSLYREFGDWWLAMAAYDWGSAGVKRAVEKTGYASFWDLHRLNVLPQETKNYVPIILAAAIIAKNPAQYGITGLNPAPPMLADNVTTHGAVGLRLVADVTGTTLDEIVALNPALSRLTTPASGDYALRIPPGTAELFNKRLATIPEEHRDAWRFHVVTAGETLDDIAKSYHSDAAEIADINRIENGDMEEGQGLAVPVAASSIASARAATATQYTARKGDTIVSISDRFGVSARQLRGWNHLRHGAIEPGQVLLVSSPAASRPAGRSRHSKASRQERGKGKHADARADKRKGGKKETAAGKKEKTSGAKSGRAATAGKSASSKPKKKK